MKVTVLIKFVGQYRIRLRDFDKHIKDNFNYTFDEYFLKFSKAY